MDILNMLLSGDIINLIYFVAAGLLAALYWVASSIWFLIKSGRLFPFFGSMVAKWTQVATENRYLNILSDQNRLPPMYVPDNAKGFNAMASVLAHRIKFYSQVFENMKVPFHGAYAISFRIGALYRPEFIKHLALRKRDFAQLVTFTDEYLRDRSQYMQEVDVETGSLQAIVNALDIKIARQNLQIRAFGLHQRYNAFSWRRWRNCRQAVAKLAKRRKRFKKCLQKLEIKRANQEKDIFERYRMRVHLLAMKIIQLDEQRLRLGIHELQADFNVIEGTVHSGRLFEDLIKETNPESVEIRKMLKLPANFPLNNIEEAKAYITAHLGGRASLSNKPAREDLLECALRVWLMEVQTEIFTSHFLNGLPLPAALGLAQAKYGHKVGTKGHWLLDNDHKSLGPHASEPMTGLEQALNG